MTLLLPVDPLAAGESCEVANCGGGAPRTMGLTAGGRMLGLACQAACSHNECTSATWLAGAM